MRANAHIVKASFWPLLRRSTLFVLLLTYVAGVLCAGIVEQQVVVRHSVQAGDCEHQAPDTPLTSDRVSEHCEHCEHGRVFLAVLTLQSTALLSRKTSLEAIAAPLDAPQTVPAVHISAVSHRLAPKTSPPLA